MTSQSDIIPVILAGGMGRRLWPLSVKSRPKPFLKLGRKHSLLQKTAMRFPALAPPAVVANRQHADLLQRHLKDIRPQQIFLEPAGRGTAAAVAVAAHYFSNSGGDPLLLVLPSDHAIRQPGILIDAVQRGASLARQGQLVMFGIAPKYPATGFGYIRRGDRLEDGIDSVARFVEKPPRTAARGLLAEKDLWLWNSGIFLFSASAFLVRLRRYQPVLHEAGFQAVARAARRQAMVLLDAPAFLSCPSLSVDRALMEKDGPRAVIGVEMGWRDLGTWPSLAAHMLGF